MLKTTQTNCYQCGREPARAVIQLVGETPVLFCSDVCRAAFRNGEPALNHIAENCDFAGDNAKNCDASDMPVIKIPELDGYPGAKTQQAVYKRIISEMPPHRVYIEMFLGSGAIMRRKKPAQINIGIDRNTEILKFWRKESILIQLKKCFLFAGDAVSLLNENYAISNNTNLFNLQSKDTLIYADPPYLLETRRGQRALYDFEFYTEADHVRLAEFLNSLNCNVILSGYRSELYSELFAGWRTIDIPTTTRGGAAIETIWLNFSPPTVLHDWRFLGKNARDRERITRIQTNLIKKIKRMRPVERFAVLEILKSEFFND